MDYQTLRLTREGAIARITLARPDDGNAIDGRTLRELADACEVISASDGVALVVIDAEGADFCRGWAEGAVAELTQSPVVDPFGCLAGLPLPVLAVLQGTVRSGGLELALAADVRFCSDDASLSLPDVSGGSLPLAGGTQRLPRIVGRSRAAAMLLLGDELDAAAALAAGLVSRVYPRDGLPASAALVSQRIASRGPIALRYAKEAVHQGLEMTLDQGLRYELDLSVILQTTSDRAEGVAAFLEKREPKFEGR